MRVPSWLWISCVAPLFAAEQPSITLTDGRVLKNARIVAIADKQVSIAHEGGALGVDPNLVPLDVLARAAMALDARAEDRRRKEGALLQKAAAQLASDQQKHSDEIQIRLAQAAVREGSQQTRDGLPNYSTRLMALKQRFPEQRKDQVRVKVGKRWDSIEIHVPSQEVWSIIAAWSKRPRLKRCR